LSNTLSTPSEKVYLSFTRIVAVSSK
jgi:hypothetical protein